MSPRYVCTKQAAVYLGMSPQWLEESVATRAAGLHTPSWAEPSAMTPNCSTLS